MPEVSEIARLVKDKTETKRLRAQLSTRPLRIAFVIRDDLPAELLAKIVEFNTVIWGGYFSCLIPSDGHKIDAKWWRVLLHHDPDKVVLCRNSDDPAFSDILIESIEKEVQPFWIYSWEEWDDESLIDLHAQGSVDRIAGLPFLYLLRHIINNLRQPVEPGNSNIRIPKISPSNRFYLSTAIQVGITGGIYEEALHDALKGEYVDFDSSDLGEYLNKLAYFRDHLSPLDFTRYNLNSSTPLFQGVERPAGLSIVLMGQNLIEDASMLWNLRLAPREPFARLGSKRYSELSLPINSIVSDRNLHVLAEVISRGGIWHFHQITLMSCSVGKRRLANLAGRLRSMLGPDFKVNVSTEIAPIEIQFLHNTSERAEILLEDNYFSFKSVSPEFGESIKAGEWVIDIDIEDNYGRSIELPFSSKLNTLLSGSPSDTRIRLGGYWIRYAYGKLSRRVNAKTAFADGFVVTAPEAFPPMFSDKGLILSIGDKHPYIEGFLSQLDSMGDIKLLEQPGVRRLLWDMRGGKTHTFGEMRGLLRMGQDENTSTIDKLVQRRILLRGIRFRCESCGLQRWYPLNTLDEVMQCSGCLKLVQPPSGVSISFRLNELADRAVSQGAIPVLLTYRMLSLHSMKQGFALFGATVNYPAQGSEVDLITTNYSQLVLAECKEFKDGANAKQIREAKAQISSLVNLAERAEARIVLFSTLLPKIPIQLIDHVKKLNRKRKAAVHLVSLTEMKLVDLDNPSDLIEIRGSNLSHPLMKL